MGYLDKTTITVDAILTKKGREMEKKVMPRVLDTYNEIRESFEQDEWDQLIDSLKKITVMEELKR